MNTTIIVVAVLSVTAAIELALYSILVGRRPKRRRLFR